MYTMAKVSALVKHKSWRLPNMWLMEVVRNSSWRCLLATSPANDMKAVTKKKKMLAEMCRRTHENHKGRNSADEVTISCIDPSAMTDGLFVGSAESLNYLLSKMWQAHFLFVCFIPFIAELWDAFCFVSPPCKIRVRPTLGWLYGPNESYKHINGSSGASKSLLVSVLGTGDYSA